MKEVHDRAKGSADFHQKLFKEDVDDPSLYHLTLNTARFPLDQAAEVISQVVQRYSARE